MGQTISEKIISAHSGKTATAGEFVIANVDVCAVQDGTGPLTIDEIKKANLYKAANPDRTILFIDHAAPSPRKELSNSHKVLRQFHKDTGAVLSDINEGVCHQRLVEDYVNPGEILIGADSFAAPKEYDIRITPKPRSDLIWMNGLANIIHQSGTFDVDFISRRTIGFESYAKSLAKYDQVEFV